MPITVGAIRKQRADAKKSSQNKRVRDTLREAVGLMRRKPTQKALLEVYRVADKAAKKGVIHKNKASRLKSRLSLLVKKK